MYVSLLFFFQFEVLRNPFTYLVLLVLLARGMFEILVKHSKGIALKIENGELVFYNSFINYNLQIPVSAVKEINIEKKYLEVEHLGDFFKSSFVFRLNRFLNGNNKVSLLNVEGIESEAFHRELLGSAVF